MRRWWIVLLALIVSAAAPLDHTPRPAYGPGIAFPFTAEEDRDGAMYVWFLYCHTGFRYEYIPASEFPQSKRFRIVDDPRNGDIAWWPGYVALYDAKKQFFMTALGEFHPDDLKQDFPKPKFYRMQLFGSEHFVDDAQSNDRTAECIPKR